MRSKGVVKQPEMFVVFFRMPVEIVFVFEGRDCWLLLGCVFSGWLWGGRRTCFIELTKRY